MAFVKKNIPIILLSGGEPTEHPYFSRIIQLFEQSNSYLFLLTNGIHCELIADSVKSIEKTTIILSLNQYDTIDRIMQIKANLDFLLSKSFRIYLNIAVDKDIHEKHFFTSKVMDIIRLVSRVYLTPYTRDVCELSKETFNAINRCYLFLCRQAFNKSIIATKQNAPFVFFASSVLARIMGERFDRCSGYPFRGTMIETGEIVPCIKKGAFLG